MSSFALTTSRALTLPEVDELKALAGAYVKPVGLRHLVRCHVNVAWLVQRTLAARGVGVHATGRIPPVPAALPAIAELQPWVDGFLLPYQREGILFSLNKDGAWMWWPGGAGKTVAALVWGLAAPGLLVLVCGAKARRQFERETLRFTVGVTPYVMKGMTPPEDALEQLSKARVAIVAWQTLRAWADVIAKARPVSVVFDESHRGKASKRQTRVALVAGAVTSSQLAAQTAAVLSTDASEAAAQAPVAQVVGYKYVDLPNTASAAEKVAKAAKRRLLTTATPIADRLRDLWGQLHLATPWGWGSFGQWAKRYTGAYINSHGGLETKGVGTHESIAELKQRLSFLVHQVDKSITHASLPPKRRNIVYIPAAEQDAESSEVVAELRTAQAGDRGDPEMRGKHHSRLLEIRLAIAASKKRSFVVEDVIEALRSRQKVVVFTGRKRDCDVLGAAIQKAVKKEKLDEVKFWVAHGEVSVDERFNIRDVYLATKESAVLVGTGDAWGESIDGLQCTDLVLFAMLPWTPERIVQWEARFSRHGSDRPVLIKYLIAEGSVDEHLASVLLDKLEAVVNVVGDKMDNITHDLATGGATDEELADSLLAKLLAAPSAREEPLEGEGTP